MFINIEMIISIDDNMNDEIKCIQIEGKKDRRCLTSLNIM